MLLAPGAIIGPYELISPLGRGGMGEVHLAHDPRLSRRVALKFLPASLAADPVSRERLRREAAAAAALDHPFLCKLYELADHPPHLFLVFEFLDGETLHHRLRTGPIPSADALRFAAEIAEALHHAHSRGFLHRDLKPANIMLTHGHAKVMDFGLATRLAAPDAPTQTQFAPLTEPGTAAGTPDYMSPEQLTAQPLDSRSDLFSYALVLAELLGNGHPFRRDTPAATMAAILRDPPALSPHLPQGLMLLLRRALAKDPADRYASLNDLRADLERLHAAPLPPAAPASIPLIGRDAELATLQRALAEALAGRGSLVLIGGEPGIGKTHLSAALLEQAKQSGAFAVRGHCYELEGAPPYSPFIEMLEHAARTAPRASFRQSLGDEAPEIAKIMPELRAMFPDIPAPLQLPAEQQRRYLFNAYRAFVERSARLAPIVAVFEDLHWADEPTLLLLQHVAQTLPFTPMLLIGTYRDVELDTNRPFARTLESLLRQKQATRLSLRRLSAEDVEQMLATLAGQPPPPSLARVIFAETEGNPFFVEEVFRHLAEEGELFDETGAFRPGLRVDQLRVPEGVRLVLGRRLDRLGPDARRMLTTAAVIGRSFPLGLLESLEPTNPDAVLDAVEEAERARLVHPDPASDREPRYRFVHELVRQTLAEGLSMPRRQRLHARIASAIEQTHSRNLDPHVSLLAHHLYQAGAAADPDKTVNFLTQAAQRATANAAHEEALAHLENALSILEDDQTPQAAALLEAKANTLRNLGRREESVLVYRAAISHFLANNDPVRSASASLSLALFLGWYLQNDVALRVIEDALRHLGDAAPDLALNLRTLEALIFASAGDLPTAVRLRDQVASTLAATPNNESAHLLAYFNTFFPLQGMQVSSGVDEARRVAAALRSAGRLWESADVEWGVGSLLLAGRIEDAIQYTTEAAEWAAKIGHEFALSTHKSFPASLAMANGDFDECDRLLEESDRFLESIDNPWRFYLDTLRAEVAFLSGRHQEIEFRLNRLPEPRSWYFGFRDASRFAFRAQLGDPNALDLWTTRAWPLPVAGTLNSAGVWCALQKTVLGLSALGGTEDVASLRPLTEELAQLDCWVGWDFFPLHTTAGLAAAAARDWSAAEHHHRIALHQTDTAPYKISQPMAREWFAVNLIEQGRPDEARALLIEAHTRYESMGMPFHTRRAAGRLAGL